MNPYIGNSPFFSQMADIGYPQVNYQSTPQDTSMQDQFQSQTLQDMQRLAVPTMPQQPNLGGQLALAQALRQYGGNQDNLAQGWKGNQWQGSGTGYTQGTSLNAPQIVGEYTAPVDWISPLQIGQ